MRVELAGARGRRCTGAIVTVEFLRQTSDFHLTSIFKYRQKYELGSFCSDFRFRFKTNRETRANNKEESLTFFFKKGENAVEFLLMVLMRKVKATFKLIFV